MPRFVVLEHDHPFLHWDLLLESGDVARAWRLLAEPVAFDEPIEAEPLPDHRIHYLDYEGPVGGDRGSVTRWDDGEFALHDDEESYLVVEMHGSRLRGRFRIELGAADLNGRLQRVESSDT